MITVPGFLGVALDLLRLALLGSAARKSVDTAAIAQDLGVSERKVVRPFGKAFADGFIATIRLRRNCWVRLPGGVARGAARSPMPEVPGLYPCPTRVSVRRRRSCSEDSVLAGA